MVATSWDQQARCYEVQPNGQTAPRSAVQSDAPLLAAAWHHEGGAVFLAGCDKQAKKWDLATNASTQVAAHDAPIRNLAWIPEMQLLVTGSWDRTLRYWDTRQGNPAFSHTLPERCYALSCLHPLLVVATAVRHFAPPAVCARSPPVAQERHIQVFNLANPQVVYKQIASPLKYQTRCVAAFPDKSGYLVGSIEGRVAVQHVEESQAGRNFTFKCHREQDQIYAVNSCAFHPVHGTFVTMGSDGCYNFWDKARRGVWYLCARVR